MREQLAELRPVAPVVAERLLTPLRRLPLSVLLWVATSALVALYIWSGLAATWRERAFDAIAGLGREPQRHVTVVDIDQAALAKYGTWPLSRAELAQVLDEVGQGKPALVVLDVLIEGPDQRSPAALARQLSDATADARLAQLAATLPDGDRALSLALQRTPTLLGAAIHPDRPVTVVPASPLITRGKINAGQFWQGEGWIAPSDAIMEHAAGLGVLVLDADPDGTTRRVPLLAVADAQLLPGLAVTAVRVFRKASTLLVDGAPGTMLVADRRLPLSADGMLRLVPRASDRAGQRTVSASDLASERARREIAGRIVVLGSSAPEAGGWRTGIGGRPVTSVQLQADAIDQILSGLAPRRATSGHWLEAIAALMAAAAAVLAGRRLPPLKGALVVFAAVVSLAVLMWLIYRTAQHLVDPLPIALAAAAGFAATSVATATEMRARAAAVRQRFEQHLAPEVVQRIVDNPQSLKLSGEMRDITAMFTDVEGFTAMTERAGAQQLIAVLDDYFDGVSRIIATHGGMIDKIVGDAVHAYFNVPFDLPAHHQRAFDCAAAILVFAADFQRQPDARALGFGRTRIGIESGQAIVGDVGGGKKLDYTAHGNVVNSAARLEAANKMLATSICVGPDCGQRLGAGVVRPIGRIELRGRAEPQPVFEPWPAEYSATERAAFLAAMALAEPTQARDALAPLAGQHPDDVSLAALRARLNQPALS